MWWSTWWRFGFDVLQLESWCAACDAPFDRYSTHATSTTVVSFLSAQLFAPVDISVAHTQLAECEFRRPTTEYWAIVVALFFHPSHHARDLAALPMLVSGLCIFQRDVVAERYPDRERQDAVQEEVGLWCILLGFFFLIRVIGIMWRCCNSNRQSGHWNFVVCGCDVGLQTRYGDIVSKHCTRHLPCRMSMS